jgi:hypothetical protein
MTFLDERVAPATAGTGKSATEPSPDIGRLTVSCVHGPGIIAPVPSFLHLRVANIIDSDEYSTAPAPGQFFLRTEFHLPGPQDELGLLQRDFHATVASMLGATFRLRDAAATARSRCSSRAGITASSTCPGGPGEASPYLALRICSHEPLPVAASPPQHQPHQLCPRHRLQCLSSRDLPRAAFPAADRPAM